MKKSKSLFKQIILFVVFISFSGSTLFANDPKDECVQLTEELKRNHLAFELDEEDGVDIIAVKIDGEVVDIKLDDGSKVELLEDLIDDDSEGSKEFKELKAFLEEEGLETVKEDDEEDVVADDEQKGGDRKNEPVEENTGVHDAIDTIKEEDLEDLEEETA